MFSAQELFRGGDQSHCRLEDGRRLAFIVESAEELVDESRVPRMVGVELGHAFGSVVRVIAPANGAAFELLR